MVPLNMSGRVLAAGLLRTMTRQRNQFIVGSHYLGRVLSDLKPKTLTTTTVSHSYMGPCRPLNGLKNVEFDFTPPQYFLTNRFYSRKGGDSKKGGDPKKGGDSKKGGDTKKDDGGVDVNRAFEQHCVVPDVLECAPKEAAQICFPSGKEANLGNNLTPTDVKDEPSKISWTAEEGSFHTLILLDPDAPSRQSPELRYWLHWLIVNIPGCDVCSGKVIADYVSSGPPKDSGLHRYVFLIYKQKCQMEFKEKELSNKSAEGRDKWQLKEFLQKYDLEHPVAGNFYQAEYDDYVPILYHQLGVK